MAGIKKEIKTKKNGNVIKTTTTTSSQTKVVKKAPVKKTNAGFQKSEVNTNNEWVTSSTPMKKNTVKKTDDKVVKEETTVTKTVVAPKTTFDIYSISPVEIKISKGSKITSWTLNDSKQKEIFRSSSKKQAIEKFKSLKISTAMAIVSEPKGTNDYKIMPVISPKGTLTYQEVDVAPRGTKTIINEKIINIKEVNEVPSEKETKAEAKVDIKEEKVKVIKNKEVVIVDSQKYDGDPIKLAKAGLVLLIIALITIFALAWVNKIPGNIMNTSSLTINITMMIAVALPLPILLITLLVKPSTFTYFVDTIAITMIVAITSFIFKEYILSSSSTVFVITLVGLSLAIMFIGTLIWLFDIWITFRKPVVEKEIVAKKTVVTKKTKNAKKSI